LHKEELETIKQGSKFRCSALSRYHLIAVAAKRNQPVYDLFLQNLWKKLFFD
jgi:hypothetical protein